MTVCCEDCIYSHEYPDDGTWECRKEPIKVIGWHDDEAYSGFPTTSPENWCGEGESVLSNALKSLDGFPG